MVSRLQCRQSFPCNASSSRHRHLFFRRFCQQGNWLTYTASQQKGGIKRRQPRKISSASSSHELFMTVESLHWRRRWSASPVSRSLVFDKLAIMSFCWYFFKDYILNIVSAINVRSLRGSSSVDPFLIEFHHLFRHHHNQHFETSLQSSCRLIDVTIIFIWRSLWWVGCLLLLLPLRLVLSLMLPF